MGTYSLRGHAVAGPIFAIDFGTSYSCAAVRRPDGRTRIIPDPGGSTQSWPSPVFADGQRLLTGSQAVHHKGERGYRENFKRILGQVSTLLLGEDMYWPEQLVGAMIQALKEAAEEYGPLARTVITIPASYAPRDRTRKLMIGER